MKFDELNTLVRAKIADLTKEKREADTLYLEDEIEDLLIYCWTVGNRNANDWLDISLTPKVKDIQESVYRKTDGKTFKDRLKDKDTDIARLVETETHRVYNEALYKTAKDSGLKISKKWKTMEDERVRDSHWVLDGVEIPFEERFYTLDGDSALYPGGFSNPENVVNCRCYIELKPL